MANWHSLKENKLKQFRLIKLSNKDEKKFLNNLNKIGYCDIKTFNLSHSKKILTKAFQMRFRQDLINGIIDKECLFISKNLLKS